jgi:hypothetical protein
LKKEKPVKPKKLSFNAHHSPIGSFSTFTLGMFGDKGGPGVELRQPANQSVVIGYEEESGKYAFLPFQEEESNTLSDFAILEEESEGITTRLFGAEEITRDFNVATDQWSAGRLNFKLISPVMSVPDPNSGDKNALKFATCPAILAELTIDNINSDRDCPVVFGYRKHVQELSFNHLGFITDGKLQGIVQDHRIAIASRDEGVTSAIAPELALFVLAEKIEYNLETGLGENGALRFIVPAGEKKTIRTAVAFYREGLATTGIDARYFYTQFFKNIYEVCDYALENYDRYVAAATQADAMMDDATHLSDDQRFMLAHSIRSYYGNTQLLIDKNKKPIWVVNEGEYRMMNTFDLTVDQLFFEMRFNPWTVRNELDLFTSRYHYEDEVLLPGKPETTFPGGISFVHDMGVANAFSRPGRSSYERAGRNGCFSHMTHEQLTNFILCAAVYAHGTKDRNWLLENLHTMEACLQSLENRDHPDPYQRDGVMGLDSSRTQGGTEITTYDSLDASLGQARANLYLAVKSWAAYVVLEKIFSDNGLNVQASHAALQAERCACTIASKITKDGYIPAVMDGSSDSRIIPAIEGLIFPALAGVSDALDENGRFGRLIRALRKHTENILKPGICIFEKNGGYRLSSTSRNTWLSKIYLSQHIIRHILGYEWDEQGIRSDAAHVDWLLDEDSAYFAWSDQMIDFKAIASKYYPRGVTSILWLDEA